jgi:hypothetical protein
MKVRFDDVKVGGVFWCQGRRFVKLALSMAQDENRTGTIFQAEMEVDVEDESRAAEAGSGDAAQRDAEAKG